MNFEMNNMNGSFRDDKQFDLDLFNETSKLFSDHADFEGDILDDELEELEIPQLSKEEFKRTFGKLD